MTARWGKKTASAGWTGVPNTLLYNQQKLGLAHAELVTLLNIISHWRENSNLPYVSKQQLAHRMGNESRTVQRYLQSLCAPRKIEGFDEEIYMKHQRKRKPKYSGRTENAPHPCPNCECDATLYEYGETHDTKVVCKNCGYNT